MKIQSTSNSQQPNESNCPAAHFRQFQDYLRESLARTLGGRKLDEATPDKSHYPYATAGSLAAVE